MHRYESGRYTKFRALADATFDPGARTAQPLRTREAAMPPALTHAAALSWAASRGAITPRQVADLLSVSTRDVRRSSPEQLANPRIILLIAAVEAEAPPAAEASTPDQLSAFRRSAKLKSLSALASQLGVSRQSMNAWGKTCSMPSWVPLACAGILASRADRAIT